MSPDHPKRGTCNDPACEFYSRCHCGCRQKTRICAKRDMSGPRNWIAGNPSIWKPGHPPQALRAMKVARDATRHDPLPAPRGDVPYERVAPLLIWLKNRVGVRQRAALLNTSTSHLWRVETGRRGHGLPGSPKVTRAFAQRVADLVLEFRRPSRPVDPFSSWEVEPQVIPQAWRDEAEREHNRHKKQRERAGQVEKRYCPCGKRILRRSTNDAWWDKCHECRQKGGEGSPWRTRPIHPGARTAVG